MANSFKYLLSTIIILSVILFVSFLISLESIRVNDIPIVFIFAITILSLNSVFFIHSYFFKSDIFFDLVGSFSFLSIGIASLLLLPDIDANQILIFFLLVFWSLRLGPFLFLRRIGAGNDERLSEYFKSPISLYFLWCMNSLWVFFTSLSMIIIFSSKTPYDFGLLQWLGLIIWVFGYIIEVISDSQKNKFNKTNKGKFINIGLWKYIRHPNYLGEIIIWFGIFVISLNYIGSFSSMLSILSPIFVYILLRYLSGVPQLEKRGDQKWGDLKEYVKYKEKTGIIFPKLK
tara:strand:+ start:2120 stop:2983 length:864 start_codon:yes stop_codon:yes gene_type:complete